MAEASEHLKQRCADLERRLQASEQEAAYYRTFAEQAGVTRLRETEILSQLLAERQQAEETLRQTLQQLKHTEAQLVQSAKLASIGELAAGIAHEINQPLMVIRATAQFLLRSLEKGTLALESLQPHFETIERNTKRMMHIITHLRTFSRQSCAKFVALDVNPIIEETFLMIGEQLRLNNIEVQKHLTPNLPPVRGDANQLEQVVLNLLANARDAIAAKGDKTSGSIEIVTQVAEQQGEWVEILVKDNGSGILPEHVSNIFDPFFTTKGVGKGTGLGLAISYGIIQEHQGEIAVAETGPGGTHFRIRLPALMTC